MTNKEASTILGKVFSLIDLNGKAPVDLIGEAFDLETGALRKRTPARPSICGTHRADGLLVLDTWKCPNCRESYEIECDDFNFCPNCGQAIDWAETMMEVDCLEDTERGE